MPFCSGLKVTSRCQTLSKALDMPKKTFLTFRLSSNILQISLVIDNRWLMRESPGLKPDWFVVISLYAEKI